MTFVNHGLVGAAIYKAIFGWNPWLLLLGFFLGSAPDTLDWIVWKLSRGKVPRWNLIYHWWHHNKVALLISAILIAPLPHVLSDKFVHPPVLAHSGDDPKMDEIMWRWPFGINLSRHDIMWLQGEFAQLFLALFFLVL